MGEYYAWANIDKKEYIDPVNFDHGCKVYESSHKGCDILRALRALLAFEWKGDRVIWLGDENREINIMDDEYIDISCRFKESEPYVREEAEFYLEDPENRIDYFGIKDFLDRYALMFFKEGEDHRYILNYDKKEYCDVEKTKVYMKGKINYDLDPIVILLGFGRVKEKGIWVNDHIGASDTVGDDFSLISLVDME